MTQEEKAKAYDEAIKKINYVIEHGVSPVLNKEDLQDIFPELKESEDEKIRKALLEMVHDTTGDELWIDYDVHKEDALVWLEKQGERKPKWSEEDEKVFNNLIGSLIRISHHTFTDCTSPNYTFFTEIEWLKEIKQRMEYK